jgi:hypothetical protein
MKPFVTFKSNVFGLFTEVPSPTAAQVNVLGHLVCTSLDEGQTIEQAKATGLAMAADNPWVTISPAGADYVVRTASRSTVRDTPTSWFDEASSPRVRRNRTCYSEDRSIADR